MAGHFTSSSMENTMSDVNKVVLAYSGGLDTSVIVRWLQDTYNCEVVTFTADIGQGEEVEPARAKAEAMGVKEIYIDDLREEFVRDFVFPMFRANTVYEGEYLLGTSIARPLIAKRLIEIANETGADAISHGATGKGNDQVRFELGAYALKPGIKVIAPWREWDLTSRETLMAYCKERDIPVDFANAKKKSPYSMDANLLHISYEGDLLEDPWAEPEEDMWRWSVSPEAAPDEPTYIELDFEKGDIVGIDGQQMSPATVLEHLNKVGGANGIGRDDIVENRYVGMKSRGCYETPGGTIMLKAHRAIESLTLDREVTHLKDELMPRYAKLVYNGYWWSPERRMLQAAIDDSQQVVNGKVRLKLYKGNVIVAGRQSADSLFDASIATFEDDAGAYDQKDAEGFIKLNALRMRIAANKGRSQL
jgi:argininosuccinate synthase